MGTHIIGADPTLDLKDLNEWIKENEMTLGPIVNIAEGHGKTAGEFDVSGDLVTAKWAQVMIKVGDQCVVGPTETLIAEGQAYISSVLRDVSLYRAS